MVSYQWSFETITLSHVTAEASLLQCLDFPLKMHYKGVKNGQNGGKSHWILTPNETVLTFWAHSLCVKFHQNHIKIVTVGARSDRETDRQKDASDFIICPMLCYSNGKDKS